MTLKILNRALAPRITYLIRPISSNQTRSCVHLYNSSKFLPDLHIYFSKPQLSTFLNSSKFSTSQIRKQQDEVNFDRVTEETLESLNERFDEIFEANGNITDSDVNLSDGVLTVILGSHGTYVINKQTPNKQIWLSSPTSGPKRYDLVEGRWIYKHDGVSLHELLAKEISYIFKQNLSFNQCSYSSQH